MEIVPFIIGLVFIISGTFFIIQTIKYTINTKNYGLIFSIVLLFAFFYGSEVTLIYKSFNKNPKKKKS